MEFQDCLICKKSKATKTNSHIIPSFIVAKVCSYDGSGKRDKEVMFTMTPLEEKLYLGAIPDTKIEELVDTQKLSDERIEQELRNNTASKDYIFCPECEKNLSVYLETPYAECLQKGKTPNVHLAVIVKTCSDIFYTIGQKKCPMPSAKIRNYSHSHNLVSQ